MVETSMGDEKGAMNFTASIVSDAVLKINPGGSIFFLLILLTTIFQSAKIKTSAEKHAIA